MSISKAKQIRKWANTVGFLKAFEENKVSIEEGFLILYNQYKFLRDDLFDAYIYEFYPLEEIDKVQIGNYRERLKIYDLVKNKQPILIYGAPGIGKTFFVRRFCETEGYHCIEINCSLYTTKEKLNRKVKFNHKMDSFSLKSALFFDEIDGVYKTGFNFLEKIIKSATVPIFLVANDISKVPQKIIKLCQKIQFKMPKNEEVEHIIALLCLYDEFYFKDKKTDDKLRRSPEEIANIAMKASDIRTAKNMLLHGIDFDQKEKIFIQNCIYLLFKEKNRELVFEELQKYFEQNPYYLKSLFVWLAENIISFYRKEPEKLKYNLKVLQSLSKSIRILKIEKILRVLAFSILHSERSGIIRFPLYYAKKKKIEKQRELKSQDIKVKIKKRKKKKELNKNQRRLL